jgi:putative intracellular protease/amidase
MHADVCRYLPEVAHPWATFTAAGYNVEFVSPKGGDSPVDPGSVTAFAKDEICTAFLANKDVMDALKSTKAIADCNSSSFKAVFVAGGHGPMWDLPKSEVHNKFVADAYEAGNVVAGELQCCLIG